MKLLSVKEVWQVLSERWADDPPGYSSVKRWVSEGRFEGAQLVGNSWVVPESALDDFERPQRGWQAGVSKCPNCGGALTDDHVCPEE